MASPTANDVAQIAVALLAGSEVLALTPRLKANSWTQLVIGILRGVAATKTRR
jgi:N-acetylmuramic acid 6-phosphate (MurNAc-6-P) etherase